ncbi:MAG TPA: cytochrome c-type biogenesis protein, partial [Sphingomonas sp.]|nr:cytochrome c-type biogenesis protein [Sphingomonas sp.]
MRRAFFALALIATPVFADSELPSAPLADTQLPDPRAEADAKALMETVRCIVCQGQSIADSNAELAGDMRALIRQRIAAGERPEAVRAWLV